LAGADERSLSDSTFSGGWPEGGVESGVSHLVLPREGRTGAIETSPFPLTMLNLGPTNEEVSKKRKEGGKEGGEHRKRILLG